MPFKYLSDIARSDDVVKILFDNIRNLGLCTIVYGAGHWQFQHLPSGFQYYLAYLYGSILYIMAFVLTFINLENGNHKLSKIKAPVFIKGILGGLYMLFVQQVFWFMANTH